MLFALVIVGLTMGVVYLHVLVFQVLDDVIGIPLTLGALALVHVLFWLFVYREEIRFTLFPGSWGRQMRKAHQVQGPVVRPAEPVGPVLMSLEQVEEQARHQLIFAEQVRTETVGLLKAVRVGMHEWLTEYVGRELPCRIVHEDYGVVSTQLFGGRYLYLNEYVDVTSGYPPVRRKRTETLAHTWKIETDHDHAEVTLTIDAERKGQLLLKSKRRWFAADLTGWRELISHLSPE